MMGKLKLSYVKAHGYKRPLTVGGNYSFWEQEVWRSNSQWL